MHKRYCRICGDKAIGFNFSVITCESCKTFFRRHALKFEVALCAEMRKCEINKSTRKKMHFLEKCLAIENDFTVRNLPRNGMTQREHILYHYTVYNYLLRRYLEHKYSNVKMANEKYHTLLATLGPLGQATVELKKFYTKIIQNEKSIQSVKILNEIYN